MRLLMSPLLNPGVDVGASDGGPDCQDQSRTGRRQCVRQREGGVGGEIRDVRPGLHVDGTIFQ